MNRIVLDFTGIQTVQALHQYFQSVFDLPEEYGHNMDALWDCLSCRYDASTTIELRNLEALPEDMASAAAMMQELFDDLHEEDGVVIEVK